MDDTNLFHVILFNSLRKVAVAVVVTFGIDACGDGGKRIVRCIEREGKPCPRICLRLLEHRPSEGDPFVCFVDGRFDWLPG